MNVSTQMNIVLVNLTLVILLLMGFVLLGKSIIELDQKIEALELKHEVVVDGK